MEADVWRLPAQPRALHGRRWRPGGVLKCIARANARCALAASASVHPCYEAARDRWWLHRSLKQQGIYNIVVYSSSIEFNPHAPRAKSDPLYSDKLLQMLLRHPRRERVCSVLH